MSTNSNLCHSLGIFAPNSGPRLEKGGAESSIKVQAIRPSGNHFGEATMNTFEKSSVVRNMTEDTMSHSAFPPLSKRMKTHHEPVQEEPNNTFVVSPLVSLSDQSCQQATSSPPLPSKVHSRPIMRQYAFYGSIPSTRTTNPTTTLTQKSILGALPLSHNISGESEHTSIQASSKGRKRTAEQALASFSNPAYSSKGVISAPASMQRAVAPVDRRAMSNGILHQQNQIAHRSNPTTSFFESDHLGSNHIPHIPEVVATASVDIQEPHQEAGPPVQPLSSRDNQRGHDCITPSKHHGVFHSTILYAPDHQQYCIASEPESRHAEDAQ